MMRNPYVLIASISGFIAVALGALVAHNLENSFTLQQVNWFDKAWRYQVFHTLALLALGFYQATSGSQAPLCRKRAVNFIGGFWLLGILGFSGGLYVMSIGQTMALALIVPVGGIAFLIGWAGLIYVSIRNLTKP